MVYEPEKMLHNSLHYALIGGTRAQVKLCLCSDRLHLVLSAASMSSKCHESAKKGATKVS